MLLHTLKLFYRNFLSNFYINCLNVLSLAIGLAVCLLIITFIQHEFSYDHAQPDRDRLVRIKTDLTVGNGQTMHLPLTSWPVAEGLAGEMPGVESYVRMRQSSAARPVYVSDQIFTESHLVWAEPSIFNVFHFPLILGDPDTALAAKWSVVLAESTARKYYGDANPVGQQIRLSEKEIYTISGVMKDIVQPSHLPAHPMILSLKTMDIPGAEYWVGRSVYIAYLLLKEGKSVADLQPLADEIFTNHAHEFLESVDAKSRIYLQPLADIHFDTSINFAFDFQPTISRLKVSSFALLAIFVLLIAGIGFINMTTARSGDRGRQVGISKAMGSSRGRLIFQFMGESFVTTILAFLVSLGLAYLILPFFNDFIGRDLRLDFYSNWTILPIYLGLALLVGLLAGTYPAFFLSRFKPCDTIRGQILPGTHRSRMRAILITVQFAISILLIICTLTVRHQLEYMDQQDPGYRREQVLVINAGPDASPEECRSLRIEALRHPGIISGTLSNHLPTLGHMEYTYEVPEPANVEMLMTRQLNVDEYFIGTLGITLVEGRNFLENSQEDISKSIIINETAAKALGWENPVGHTLDALPGRSKEEFQPVTIVGVVKDIHYESFHHAIQPMVLAPQGGRTGRISFRLETGDIPGHISHLKKLWAARFPQVPFVYRFLDDTFMSQYSDELRLRKMFVFFTFLAILISCTGLIALTIYSAERRTREIGIRKVLGAGTSQLVYLLSKHFLLLVIIANIIAWPAAYFVMSRWMEDFAYRASFPWWLYPAAAFVALLLALVASAGTTWRASRANPAESLRQE